MNIRDERTVGEQVKSGFRLAGWVLLTLAFIWVVLGSTNLLLGKGDYTRPIYRLLGAFGLMATSAVMFATARHWVKWFVGVLGYLALKTLFVLSLGSSVARPRLWFLEFALLLGLAVALSLQSTLSSLPRRAACVFYAPVRLLAMNRDCGHNFR